MAKFRKDLFYSVDQWFSKNPEGLLNNPEAHWLLAQAKNARIALEEYLEGAMGEGDE